MRFATPLDLQRFRLPSFVFIFTFSMLSVVQAKTNTHPVILLERFVRGGGWLESMIMAFYGAFVAYKMQNPVNVPKWRRITWSIFSVVFFTQLVIGLLGAEKFLMTGKLHLSIPMMILAGPLYRGHLSVMTVLFLSTILLTGPAWCSQLCYFGAFDNIAASGKPMKGTFRNKKSVKATLLLLVVSTSLLLRWFNISVFISTIIATGFGAIGIVIMIFYSRSMGKMSQCVLYCPIGTIVNVLKLVNPFRMVIDKSCNLCMKCISLCKYDALNIQDVRNKLPNFSCTLCGDCLAACRDNSIQYRFFNMDHEKARNLYLVLTISLHAIFLAIARI
jgi:ferredoxin-type protein NapH